jgi:hypothetical protein
MQLDTHNSQEPSRFSFLQGRLQCHFFPPSWREYSEKVTKSLYWNEDKRKVKKLTRERIKNKYLWKHQYPARWRQPLRPSVPWMSQRCSVLRRPAFVTWNGKSRRLHDTAINIINETLLYISAAGAFPVHSCCICPSSLKINVTPCGLAGRYQRFEEIYFQSWRRTLYVSPKRRCLPQVHTALQPIRPTKTFSWLWEPQFSYEINATGFVAFHNEVGNTQRTRKFANFSHLTVHCYDTIRSWIIWGQFSGSTGSESCAHNRSRERTCCRCSSPLTSTQ